MYSHDTDHSSSCRRLQAVKKWERQLVVYVCRVCCGSKNSKNVSFRSIMISLEKSVSTWQFPVNKVIKFGPCWEAPYLWLVTYWQWHYRISWENGGRITKTPALIAGAPLGSITSRCSGKWARTHPTRETAEIEPSAPFPFPSFVLFSLPFLRLPRRLCMGKKPIVSVTYENERISIKNSLPYLVCVTSLLCGPRAELWPFYGFLCKRFSLYIKIYLDMERKPFT